MRVFANTPHSQLKCTNVDCFTFHFGLTHSCIYTHQENLQRRDNSKWNFIWIPEIFTTEGYEKYPLDKAHTISRLENL